MVTKIIFSRSAIDAAQKPYYCGSSYSTCQGRLAMTALPGFAAVRSTRATAANHRQLISAFRRGELGVANSNVTSEVTG
jgi:hypothetical protein